MQDKPVSIQHNDDELLVASSNFESQKFVSVDTDTIRIKPTVGSLVFGAVFALMGLGLVAYWGAATFGILDSTGLTPLLFVGLIFVVVGLLIYRSSNKQVVINRVVGVAFINSWSPTGSLDKSAVTKHFQPNEIVGIQGASRLVERHKRKRNRTRTPTYVQYQVNLHTSDKKRHNIFVTLKPENAQDLGNKIAALFSVPLKNE